MWKGELNEKKNQKNIRIGGWFSFSLSSEETQDNIHSIKTVKNTLTQFFFIYFVTTSYTFPKSLHSDTTVTQDKGIWHIVIKAKTSIESTDYYCFLFKKFLMKKYLALTF